MNRHNVIWNGWLLPTTLSIVFFLCGCDKKATTVDREQTKRQSEATATSQQVPANGPKELRVLGEVPPFSLIDQAGEAFDRTKLDGKIWVSTFIFTRCGSTCPGKVAQTITQLLDQQSPNRADEVTEIAEPKDVRDPPWLAARAEAQIAKASQYNVVCDFKFTDELASSGIQFKDDVVQDVTRLFKAAHYDHGSGLAVADVDGDGLLDIYFVSQFGPNELWKNVGSGKFEDITQTAGVAEPTDVSVGASFADVDNDGDADLYLTRVRSPNKLFLNDGSG